jgi:hypothetical protein
VTVTCLPTATLASVSVCYNAVVEGRNRKSVSKGTQEAEECFTGDLIPSASGVLHEWDVQRHSTGSGAQHSGNGHVRRHMCLGAEFCHPPLHKSSVRCSPYTEVYESVKAVPIVPGATVWTDERTGSTYTLVVNEGLRMPDTVTASLIDTNKLRAYGITVQGSPFAGPMYIKMGEKRT